MAEPFPSDWDSAVVMVAHPDDAEYAASAAVAKWTAQGRTVRFVIASRGEAGMPGTSPIETALIRAREQRAAAAVVGVHDVEFWDFSDGDIRDTAELRTKIGGWLTTWRPDLVVTLHGGPELPPGTPNHRDHIEFVSALHASYDDLTDPPTWLVSAGSVPTHVETVDGFVDHAVRSLSAHAAYLSALDPDTPVAEQARKAIEATLQVRSDEGGQTLAGFALHRHRQTDSRSRSSISGPPTA